MTPERAIELLKISTEISFAHNIAEKRNEPRYAYMIAKTAIERCMVAKKPKALINKKTIKIGNAKWNKGTTVFKCSNCGQFISRIYKHCGDCGQLIDWSDVG